MFTPCSAAGVPGKGWAGLPEARVPTPTCFPHQSGSSRPHGHHIFGDPLPTPFSISAIRETLIPDPLSDAKCLRYLTPADRRAPGSMFLSDPQGLVFRTTAAGFPPKDTNRPGFLHLRATGKVIAMRVLLVPWKRPSRGWFPGTLGQETGSRGTPATRRVRCKHRLVRAEVLEMS